MRNQPIATVLFAAALAAGCTGSIESGGGGGDDAPVDTTKDYVVGFSFVSPIGVGQLGRNTIFDACVTETGCREQMVELMAVTVDRGDVLSSSATTGAAKFDVRALAAGTANVSVMAQNTGVAATMAAPIEVLTPTSFELTPMGPFVRTVAPLTVNVPHTCAPPITFETSTSAGFSYKLLSMTTPLLGSGFYPWTSDQLTEVAALDPGSDSAAVRYVAGPNATASTITSLLGPDIPITIVDTADINGLLLTDQFKAPTAEQERLIWAEATTGGTPVCFDSLVRTARSDTPLVCNVVDRRDAATRFKGAGPYQLEWLGAGDCTVTFEAPGGLTVSRTYMPLP
jgi:hypothetical protein